MIRWRIQLTAPGEPPFGIKQQYIEVVDNDIVEALRRGIEASDMQSDEIRGVEMIQAH